MGVKSLATTGEAPASPAKPALPNLHIQGVDAGRKTVKQRMYAPLAVGMTEPTC